MLTTQGAGPGASDGASAASDTIELETSTPEGGGAAVAAAAGGPAAVPPWSSSSPSSRSQRAIPLPSLASLSRTFDLFYERHFAVDFCSFDYRRHFDAQYEEKPFLVVSIISLCAQYLTPEEAWRDYGLSTGRHVWRRYLSLARSLAKELSDTPTGTSTLPLCISRDGLQGSLGRHGANARVQCPTSRATSSWPCRS